MAAILFIILQNSACSHSTAPPRALREIKLTQNKKAPHFCEAFADWTGLEPATSAVTGRHSNQLNYQSKYVLLYYSFPKGVQR